MIRRNIVVRIAIIILAPISLYYFGGALWYSSLTILGFFTITAFVSVAGISIVALRLDEDNSLFNVIIGLLFSFYAVQYLGTSIMGIYYQQTPEQLLTVTRLFYQVISITILSILSLAGIISKIHGLKRKKSIASVGVLITVIILLISLAYSFIFSIGNSNEFGSVLSNVAAILSILLFLLSAGASVRYRNRISGVDFFRFSAANMIFLVSVIPLSFIVDGSMQYWTLSLSLQGTGLFILYLSIMIPWLTSKGLKLGIAYVNASLPIFVVLIPYLAVIALQIILPVDILIDTGAYLIAHLGAASLSAVMAYLIKVYSDIKPNENQAPLIFMFASWAIVNLAEVIESLAIGLESGESIIPYIIGSFVTATMLVALIRRLKHKNVKEHIKPTWWLVLGIVHTLALILVGEYIQFIVMGQIPGLQRTPVSRSVLLAFNLVNMALFVYVASTLTVRDQKRISVETLAVWLLTLWIVPNVMKSIFLAWTIGWWVAEVFMAMGLALGPALLGYQYVQAISEAEASDRKASLFADILMHDVSNYQQAMKTSLELATFESIHDEIRQERIDNALDALNESERLVSNLRKLISAQSMKHANLQPTNLQRVLKRAATIAKSSTDRKPEIQLPEKASECFVLANELLIDVFLNLFLNAIESSDDSPRIEVDIHAITSNMQSFWRVEVADFGRGIKPSRKEDLFRRFMEGAKGTGLGLSLVKALVESYGGEVSVRDRVPRSFSKGTKFVLDLRRTEPK
ncbi:HAMP domain-containing histidine kinase [Candidatus Thorarchaeota archaeon]|nr:MAG: HAMP domain-containing histidine kinase [Candidatus Thorarchaeota archaeon]